MVNKTQRSSSWLIIPLCGLLVAMILRPEQAFTAASSGLGLWYRVVVPSLLPFFMLSELLVMLGAANVAGRWLSPLMRPLFNLPGAASLAVLMGFSAGFPTGAAITAALLRDGMLTRDEASRLVAFTNNAGPLFICVSVAVGMLGCPQAAPCLVLAHYGLNLLLGVTLGCLSRRKGNSNRQEKKTTMADKVPVCWAAMLKTAARRAGENILLIGCYMTFFSLAAALITPADWAESHSLVASVVRGLLEISNGAASLSACGLTLLQTMPLISAQLAFGGLSVQSQVLAMMAGSGVPMHKYLISRPLHAVAAALLTALLCRGLELPVYAVASTEVHYPWAITIGIAGAALLLWLALCGTAKLLALVRADHR